MNIEGVPIRPGDLVVADGSGICTLPIGRAETILQTAALFAADGRQAEDESARGPSFREALANVVKI